MPCIECELGAGAHIVEEDVAHAAVYLTVVNDKTAFEIIFEAAVIEVCGARDHKVFVNDDSFGVEHPRIVEIYLYSGTQALGHI